MKTKPINSGVPGSASGESLALDLVMPVYNEARELPFVLDSLARQTDASGQLLPPKTLRVVAVDNGSTDASADVLRSWAARADGPDVVVLSESEKSHVLARIRGADFVLGVPERSHSPFIVFTDSDSTFPPTFVYNIMRRLLTGEVDVVSHHGFPSTAFWRRVPQLARRQFEEVGTISFSPETVSDLGFDEREAVLTHRVFEDFQHLPTHCGLAMTKEIYRKAGGYAREFNRDGTERLGVARNLLFRVDRVGARMACHLSPAVDVNPRRQLLEAEEFWSDKSYTLGMKDLRDEITDEHYRRLDSAADRLDYETTRRNSVQRFIVDPCIARPARLLQNRDYFGRAFDTIRQRIEELYASRDFTFYSEIRPLSDELVDAHYRTIIECLRRRPE